MTVTATIRAEKHAVYQDEVGPVLTAISVERAQAAAQEYVTF